jgi:urea transport system permease protein
VGAIVGAFLVNLLYSYLTGAFPGTWLYFLGALFIGVVLYFPDGIAGIVGQLRQRFVGAK